MALGFLEKQTLSRDSYEVLMMDGGSTDATRDICRKHKATVIHNPQKLTEPGVALGFTKARAPLVMILAADNLYPDRDSLKTMISVFDDPKVVAAFPKHGSGPDDNLYSRYINTFTDPLTHFVYGDAANTRTFRNIYKTLLHTDIDDVYDFRSNTTRPILALAQGFTIRKSLLPPRKEVSDDILTVYRLIDEGKKLLYVYSVTLWHYTIRDLAQFISKTRRGVENALLRQDSGITKRASVMTWDQRLRFYLFVPYSLSVVFPVVQSIVKAVTTGEPMWLIHWYFSFIAAAVIAWTAVPLIIKKML